MCITTTLSEDMKASIRDTVAALFADMKTPAQRYGIDPEKIERIEMANPHVAKQGVPLVHPLNM